MLRILVKTIGDHIHFDHSDFIRSGIVSMDQG